MIRLCKYLNLLLIEKHPHKHTPHTHVLNAINENWVEIYFGKYEWHSAQ